MPRVAAPRKRPAAVAAPERPRLPDRPGRMKLLLRRQRFLLRPLALLLVLAMGGITLAGMVHSLGTGTNWRERFGSAAGRLGLVVRHVEIIGRQKTPEPLLRAAVGAAPGDPILGISLADMRARIESINWVRSAVVERRLPDTLIVRVTERSPYAVWQNKGVFRLIDENGNVVADSDVAAFAGQLPLVVGTGADTAAASLIKALARHADLQARVAAAVRVGGRRWNLHLSSGTDIKLPEAHEDAALDRLDRLQADHALLDRPLAVIDMRLPDRLVLRPAAAEKAATDKPATPAAQAKKT